MAPSPIESAARAQKIVSDPAVSAWVDASAGSGKTKVLTDRALRLMLAGAEPNRILCLTFTKAAAAEMANRIVDRLSAWASADRPALHSALADIGELQPDAPMLARAATLFAKVIDAPGGLKVQTVHAFCQSALERFPVEAGVPPGFAALDERASADLLRSARDATLRAILEGAEGDPQLPNALDRLVLRGNAEAFDALLNALLSERARISRLGSLEEAIQASWQAIGVHGPEDADRAFIARAISAPGNEAEQKLRRLIAPWMGGGKSDQKKAALLAAWLAAECGERAATVMSLFSAFFTKDGEGSAYATSATKSVLKATPQFGDHYKACEAWTFSQRDRLWTADCAADIAAALRLADVIGRRYERAKRVAGGLDFDDLILKTRDLLQSEGGAGWALYKLDAGVNHILVDEAQDTNPEQWAIINALAQEFYRDATALDRTLFAVGDPKQSIFSFQRADPAEFAHSRERFHAMAESAGQVFEVRPLETSFRSVPVILRAVDATFASERARYGLSPDHAAPSHTAARARLPGRVELWPILQKAERAEKPDRWTPLLDYPDDALDGETKLAHIVAAKIDALLSNPKERLPPSPKAPGGRRIHAGDIMVVVQTRSPFGDALARALKTRDIDTAGVDRMNLTRQLVVRDLLALGAIAILPEDDLSLAALLKSPLIGFSEEALLRLAYGRGKQPLWRRLQDFAGQPGSEFADAWEFVREAMARADFAPPFDFYQWALGPAQGRARLIAAMGEAARDPADALLSLALSYTADHAPSLQGFLGWVERDQVEIKRQLDDGAAGVRILTAHAAKGLQAPVVFLPQTTRGDARYGLGLFWTDTPGTPDKPTAAAAPVLAPSRQALDPQSIAPLRAARAARQEEERRRLLYVAMTRAEDRLYVCGWETNVKPDKQAGTWHGLVKAGLESLEDIEEQAVDFAEAPMLILNDLGDADITDAVDTTPESPGAHDLPAWWGAPLAPQPSALGLSAPSCLITDPAPGAPPVVSPLEWGEKARAATTRFGRGLIIHRLLERLPALAPDARQHAAERYLARQDSFDAAAQADILQAVFRVLDDPEFAPIFAPGGLAEAPIAGVVAGQPIAGVIDRLLVTDTDVLIVDYKSNRPPPSDAAATPEAYLAQMAVYRDLAAQAFPGRTIKTALLWTDAPRLVILPDALLAPFQLTL